jgi:hypothetical protein
MESVTHSTIVDTFKNISMSLFIRDILLDTHKNISMSLFIQFL